ncbi:YkvI family membrane protein [Lutispora saccharofermentans]|uniref:Membrane protein YkvI n=1 Tax=Lutispora saccharofermentans TaxID=3024236 RepID=A0ABT1NCK1_9FIRM|nr:hypothetical protein [Lutispora saccharofermentans]MCQ1528992.1 hypothetical protein [Lutispora saccharofermentans]
MKKGLVLSFRIGAAFIGTVIGAGYASGQEIMQFFSVFGAYGMITLLLSGFLFIITAVSVFNISARLKAFNYRDFVCKLCGGKIGGFYDAIITLFLFLGTSIMFSGSCEIFKAYFHLPKIYGIAIICFLTLLAVFKSIEGLLSVNSIIVPAISAVVILASIALFKDKNMLTLWSHIDIPKNSSAFKAFFFMFFYCSYNLMLSLGVLTAFPQDIKSKKALSMGAFIGGFGLMVLAFLLNALILTDMPEVLDKSLPMIYITRGFHPYFRYALALCIWGEIYSTAVSDVFSLANRLSSKKRYSYKAVCTAIVLCSIPLSLFDFKSLVAFFYPLFGALSIFLIVCIIYYGKAEKLKPQ